MVIIVCGPLHEGELVCAEQRFGIENVMAVPWIEKISVSPSAMKP